MEEGKRRSATRRGTHRGAGTQTVPVAVFERKIVVLSSRVHVIHCLVLGLPLLTVERERKGTRVSAALFSLLPPRTHASRSTAVSLAFLCSSWSSSI